VSFTCYGDVDSVPREQRMALKRSNVIMVDTTDSKKGSADRAIERVRKIFSVQSEIVKWHSFRSSIRYR
jgi:hypothetical protein